MQIDIVWALIVVGPVLFCLIISELRYQKMRKIHEAQRRRVMKSMGIKDDE